jgi:hypothetical protein
MRVIRPKQKFDFSSEIEASKDTDDRKKKLVQGPVRDIVRLSNEPATR